MACCPFFCPSLVRTDSTLVQTLKTDPAGGSLELTPGRYHQLGLTCQNVVRFLPQSDLALDADRPVPTVSLPEGVGAGLGAAVELLVPVLLTVLTYLFIYLFIYSSIFNYLFIFT